MTAVEQDATPTADEILASYETPTNVGRRYLLQACLVAAGILAVVLAGAISIQIGTQGATLREIFDTIWGRLTGSGLGSESDQQLRTIIWELRLPRVLLAALGGAALAVAGTLFQALLRNPLVSSYTLGTAPAAAFGAALSILALGSSSLGGNSVVLGALVAAFLNTAIVLALASAKRLETTTLILLGIALTQLFGALTAGIQYFANDDVLAAIVRWTWGSVNDAVWYQVRVLAVLFAVTYPYLQLKSGALNAIAFAGDDAAKSLGVPVARMRLQLIAVATVLTAVTISFTGIIGFVGLVGPHIARLLIGANHRFLVPFSAAIGALVLLIADAVGRLVLQPTVVPLGIVDALIGAPIFIYLVISHRKGLS